MLYISGVIDDDVYNSVLVGGRVFNCIQYKASVCVYGLK